MRHYYRQRLADPAFWRKLLGGGVALGALRGFWANLRAARGGHGSPGASPGPASFQERMAAAWHRFSGPVQLVLSGRDLTAREFTEHADAAPAWAGWRQRPGLSVLDMPEADHTFSDLAQQQRLEAEVARWWQRQEGPA